MFETEMKGAIETEEFIDELSDEALDREEVFACSSPGLSCRGADLSPTDP